jgi:TonB family protein
MKTLASSIVAAAFALTACASGPSLRSPVAKKDKAKPAIEMPTRVNGNVDLSNVDSVQLQKLLRQGSIRTDVRICVAPNGQVSKAEIVKGAGQEWFNQALLANIANWTYEPFQATTTAARCQTVKVDLRS